MVGGLNLPSVDWTTVQSRNPMEQSCLDAFNYYFVTQHVTQPTSLRTTQQANTLDLVITNE